MLARSGRIKRCRIFRRDDVRLIRKYRVRLFLFATFLSFLTYGYYCVAMGGRNASYFFTDQAFDSGAGDLAVRQLLTMVTRCRWISIYASLVIFIEWLVAAWCAHSDFEGHCDDCGIEFPHTNFLLGRKFESVLNLWQERFLYCKEKWGHASFGAHLMIIGREEIQWRDFATAACEFRALILSQNCRVGDFDSPCTRGGRCSKRD